MKKLLSVLIFSCLPLFWNCGENNKADITNQKSDFNEDFTKTISLRLSSTDSSDILFIHLKDNYEVLKNYYLSREFQPVLLKDFNSKNKLDSLLKYIYNAKSHGINPHIYSPEIIIDEFNKANDKNIDLSQRYFHLANTELILANSILNYSVHLREGIVNPYSLFAPDYEIPIKKLNVSELIEPLQQEDIFIYLHSIQPKSERYIRLQEELKKFEGLLNEQWETIPIPSSKVEPGDNYQYINLIIKKLALLVFIDSSKVSIKNFSKYDKSLIEPIKLFQKSHGLAEDGVIGKGTIERLNISLEEYLEKIKLNLERFRWNDYSDTNKYVLVNIPDFKLKIIENKEEILEIKVCTGRKVQWQTPILYGELSYLVLNPTWSVPQNIVQEEIIDGLKKDSLYLKKRSFKAFKGGKPVSLDEIDISELKTKKYTLIQDPGAGNALGKIKFMFDNPFGVNLHDTPSRAAFNYVNRAVSHGCVRVEKPYLLAEFLLKDNSDWTVDYVKIETGYRVSDKNLVKEFPSIRNQLRKNFSYGKTTEVRLYQKIPLFIDYYTCWVDENGILNFRDDVYGKDEILKKHLRI